MVKLPRTLGEAEVDRQSGTLAPRASQDCHSVPAESCCLWVDGQDVEVTPALTSLADSGRSSCAAVPHQCQGDG